MNSTTVTTIDPEVERQKATAFVTNLIICRHHIQSYPKSHPIVTAALQKAITTFAPLASDGKPFTLGITPHGVLLKSGVLGSDLVKFRELATILASLGIITISFSADLQAEDIHLFNSIISRPRKEIWETAGIKNAFAAAGLKAIKVQAIDPSVFTLTDEFSLESDKKSVDPWDIFVRKLLDGYFVVSSEKMQQLMSGPPAELAKDFQAILAGIPEEAHHHTIKALAGFFTTLAQQQGFSELGDEALNKIASFITGISPRLRRDFLLNICNSTQNMSGFSEWLLQRLPGDALLEAMQSVATHGENIPEMILGIMQRLSAHSKTTPALDAAISGSGTAEKVRILLKESALEQFVPLIYLQTLRTILATDTLPPSEIETLNELRKTLEIDSLEAKTSDMIFEIIKVMPATERGDGIKRNLMGLTSHYIGNGDFHSIEQTCRMIVDEAHAADGEVFFDPGFVQQILDAASLLREKHPDIRSLIRIVGQPFVVPLMERLFDEANRSLRRFWFVCLGDLGEMVRSAALERLNDERWFAVRNLLILLRAFSDQEVQRHVRRLVGHSHPKVRTEALKSLLCYHDPKVDSLLMHDLESADPARQLAAVQIAEMSSNPEIFHKLIAILNSGGIADYGLEIKSAVVQTLATIGNVQALPKLKEILFSVSFLHPGKHAKLKTVIIRALPRFPASQARSLLQEITASGGKNIAHLAAETLKGFHRIMP